MFRIPGIPHRQGQISTYEIQKLSAQNQACVSLKQKERKLYEPPENESQWINSVV